MNATEYANEIQTRLAELANVESELESKRAAGAAARAELEALEMARVVDGEDITSGHRRGELAKWQRQHAAALEGLSVERGIPELEAERGRLATHIEVLRAARIPEIDDAAAAAKARREELETSAAADRARLDQLVARRRELGVEQALGHSIDAGEPTATDEAIAAVQGSLEVEDQERGRLEQLLEDLDARREADVSARNDSAKASDLEAWAEHQVGMAAAAAQLVDHGLAMAAIADRRRIPTRRDTPLERGYLEAIAERVAGWQLVDVEPAGS